MLGFGNQSSKNDYFPTENRKITLRNKPKAKFSERFDRIF